MLISFKYPSGASRGGFLDLRNGVADDDRVLVSALDDVRCFDAADLRCACRSEAS